MLDIDHFKRVNDTYGHSTGDEVIKMVAKIIGELVRDVDLVARFGGEEFCVVLPGAPLEQACLIAERCRKKIAASPCNGVTVRVVLALRQNDKVRKHRMNLLIKRIRLCTILNNMVVIWLRAG